MQLHNLSNISIEKITECFNKAFENYFVTIKLEPKQMADKIKSQNIVLKQSVGVTANNQLIGFILIGIHPDNKTAYNAGTGIIPEFRGQQLPQQMYDFAMPRLTEIGIKTHLLEVICDNVKALNIYKNIGYSVQRKVVCLRGNVTKGIKANHKTREINIPEEQFVKSFWNYNPTYQNSLFCINNIRENHSALGIFHDEKLAGYIIYDKNSLAVKQFAVDKGFRKKGIGYALFQKVQQIKPDTALIIVNMDERDLESISFLQNIGFSPFLYQYEMKSD